MSILIRFVAIAVYTLAIASSSSRCLAQWPSTDMERLPSLIEEVPVVGVDAVLTMDTIESIALANNPTLKQAAAQVQAVRGSAFQAGRYPNPIVGYTSDQIGINGTAGELQGGFVSQEIVTGGKLRLSQSKYLQRVQIAETNVRAQQYRVLNDVRIQFYRTMGAQRLVEIHRALLSNGEDNVQTHREMLNLGQTNHAGLLRSEVDAQRDRLDLKQAENELQNTWRNLGALLGMPEIPPSKLAAPQKPIDSPLEWDAALDLLLSNSPEMQAAWQRIRHDEIAVRREQAQPIPNIFVDVNGGWNAETRNTVAGVTIGLPLPIFDRNRGTIQQAQADLTRSHEETRRLELELRTRLANHFREYQTSWQRVSDYGEVMLPKAKQAYDLLQASYKARRVAWPEVLMAQRYYLMLRTEYVRNLMAYRRTDVAIRGMLLTGGLTQPAGPMTGGHIDAVPKPR